MFIFLGVSSMMFECGGLQFPGAPFAGWYQGTEVATKILQRFWRRALLRICYRGRGLLIQDPGFCGYLG